MGKRMSKGAKLYVYEGHGHISKISREDFDEIMSHLSQAWVKLKDCSSVNIDSWTWSPEDKCGIISCEDLHTKDWVKSKIKNYRVQDKKYRAWEHEEKKMTMCSVLLDSVF